MLEVALVVAVAGVVLLGVLLVRAWGARVESEKRAVAAVGERDRAMALAERAQSAERAAEGEVESLRVELKQSDTSLREKLAEVADLRARRENAERDGSVLGARAQGLEQQLTDASESVTRLEAAVAALQEKLNAEVRDHETTRQHMAAARKSEVTALNEQWVAKLESREAVVAEQAAGVRREKQIVEERLREFETKFREVFGNLAAEALKGNREAFIAMAEQKLDAKRSAVDDLVKPIAETLKKTDEKLAVIEAAGVELKSETGKLVRALREPHVRGRYGELQLRRVAELAGMAAYCDFCEQDQTRDADGQALRPDMIVRMPSERTVVVDAKTNTQAYIDAVRATSVEEQERHLDRFAKHVADQAVALGRKKYWAQYDGSPEFVVMFIPGDQFVDAALSRQPEILERAAEQGVILASPSTLIGLLRAVAVGYKEEQLAKAAGELRELGKELHERMSVAMGHAVRIGKSLGGAVEAYNDFVGSYERRLEPVMRKFEDGGVKSSKDLPEVREVEVKVRAVESRVPASPSNANGPGLLDGLTQS